MALFSYKSDFFQAFEYYFINCCAIIVKAFVHLEYYA